MIFIVYISIITHIAEIGIIQPYENTDKPEPKFNFVIK